MSNPDELYNSVMGKASDHLDAEILKEARSGISITEIAHRQGVTNARIYQRLGRADPDWRTTLPGLRRSRKERNDSADTIMAMRNRVAVPRPPSPAAAEQASASGSLDSLTPRTLSDRWLLTPSEAAACFAVDPKTITRWAKGGRLSFVTTLGGHRRYPRSEIEKLLANGSTPATPLKEPD